MSVSNISLRSKQSLGTAMCLEHVQETIRTFLWDIGAIIWGCLTKLSKREEVRVANFPKLTSSVLRMQGFLGASTIHYPKSISLIKMFFTCSCSYEYAYVLLWWLGRQQRGFSNVCGINNKSSSTVHFNSVRRFLYFVCRRAWATLLKQKVYYSSQNRNDTDNKEGNVK